MLCKKVQKQLSEYFDEVLDSEASVHISRHLEQCENCRKELDKISILHDRLSSVEKVLTPDYLEHLVRMRLKNETGAGWYVRLKDAMSLRWSRIRTTEFQFYWTRALGTVMAAFFFVAISSGIDPLYHTGYTSNMPGRDIITWEYSKQVQSKIATNFGRYPIEKFDKNSQINPAISDEYINRFWDSDPKTGGEDGLSVVTMVNPNGTVTIDKVLENPDDEALLDNFYDVFDSARGRPAKRNGKSLTFPWVLNALRMTISADYPEDADPE